MSKQKVYANTMMIFPRRFIVSVLALCLWCGSQVVSAQSDFRVVASIKPIHSLLAGLMEGLEPPELLVSGADTPFNYQPDAQQLAGLSTADMVVWVGPELEAFLEQPLSEIGQEPYLLTLLDNPELKILDSRWNNARRDPYFWLDSRNGLILIDELTRALVRVDPARSHLYKRNRDTLFQRMALLDRQLEYGYRGLKKGLAFSYYDTQQYFEQAYALKIGESIAESPGSQIKTDDFLEARNKLASGGYSCLLIEDAMESSNLGLFTQGLDIQLGHLDSLGTRFKAGSDLYFELMEFNTRAIKNCFEQASVKAGGNQAIEVQGIPDSLGGRFLLVDHNGNVFTDEDMLGKYRLIFFGYTSCPDVCPSSLLVAAQAMKKLGDKADEIQVYFISVDPERDTPEALNTYVHYFSENFTGLTGTETMIRRVASSYKVKFEKLIEPKGSPDSYAMDHTASFFLLDSGGEFITKFPFGTTAEQLADRLRDYMP